KLSHSARSKEIFAVGAVNASLFLKHQNKGIFTMSDLLADK
ncbi:MAG: 4-hydroxy-tetrahydrodipicolinate reductase, partial [Clostridia bacterium]|nr:4-hydroxy-tetrahydrodipicolinate reductase [Clostridia bacterium]